MKFINDKKLMIRRIFLILLDTMLISIASFSALFVRFDFRPSTIPLKYIEAVVSYLPINIITTIIIFAIFRLYNSLWKYASIDEMINIVFAGTISGVMQLFGMHFILHIHVPRSYYPLSMIFLLAFIIISRFLYRYVRRLNKIWMKQSSSRIMIIGAGEAASAIIKEINTSEYVNGSVICAIDDNKNKLGSYIHGVKVVGDRNKIIEKARKHNITDIFIAIPTASKKDIKEILEICKKTNCNLKILPGIYQLINEEVSVSRLRNVDIEDLLGREPVKINLDEIVNYLSNKVVMVTGGGGSIGSELCRQIAKSNPKKLIIFDIYENSSYSVQQELKHDYPNLDLTVLIGSICNTNQINRIMKQYKPNIIFHAAAHKHVPLMEDSPHEAIINNVGGTYKLAQAADKFNVEKFIFISTDKAVNPTSVMGASKRICEMIVQAYANKSKTIFAAVRFGNVLGSSGSVVPLFREQILRGGPVTVTHPDIIRYFMTIPEAVSLVLQAGAYAKGGEIFILDMGEPVKIKELAENLIRLSGYEPYKDIMIEYSGLRPGEKLYEELLFNEEDLIKTNNKSIFIGRPIKIDEDSLFKDVELLYNEAEKEDGNILKYIKKLVPTYKNKEIEK